MTKISLVFLTTITLYSNLLFGGVWANMEIITMSEPEHIAMTIDVGSVLKGTYVYGRGNIVWIRAVGHAKEYANYDKAYEHALTYCNEHFSTRDRHIIGITQEGTGFDFITSRFLGAPPKAKGVRVSIGSGHGTVLCPDGNSTP